MVPFAFHLWRHLEGFRAVSDRQWKLAPQRRSQPRACAVAAGSPGSTRPGRGTQASCTAEECSAGSGATAGGLCLRIYFKKGSKCSLVFAFIAGGFAAGARCEAGRAGEKPAELSAGRRARLAARAPAPRGTTAR